MSDATATSAGLRQLPRDSRVDGLRGIALIMIFIDHIPGNLLSQATLRNFGFADAAELFVLLAGFASMVAYGGSFAREGVLLGLRRVFLRCLRLYLFQAVMMLAVLVLVSAWLHYFGVEPASGAPFVHSGLNGLRHGLTLQAQPASLNILPLYIILLALFPLIYGLIAISPIIALLASCALWIWVKLEPSINLTNWLDGQGWFFDPFAWQFLFVIGALGAVLLRRYDGNLPRPPWLRVVAWGYLGFALVAAAPWDTWGWSSFHPIVLDAPDKTVLAPLRLLDVLALAVLALSSIRFRILAELPALRLLVVCGRNSLEVFALGTMLAMICRLAFRTFGVTRVGSLSSASNPESGSRSCGCRSRLLAGARGVKSGRCGQRTEHRLGVWQRDAADDMDDRVVRCCCAHRIPLPSTQLGAHYDSRSRPTRRLACPRSDAPR